MEESGLRKLCMDSRRQACSQYESYDAQRNLRWLHRHAADDGRLGDAARVRRVRRRRIRHPPGGRRRRRQGGSGELRIPIEELYSAPERLERVAKFPVEHWKQRRSGGVAQGINSAA